MEVALLEEQLVRTVDRGEIAAINVVLGDMLLGYDTTTRRPVWVTVTGMVWAGSDTAYTVSSQGLQSTDFSGAAFLQTDQGAKAPSAAPNIIFSPCALNMRNLLRRVVTSVVQTTDAAYLTVQFTGANALITGGYLLAAI